MEKLKKIFNDAGVTNITNEIIKFYDLHELEREYIDECVRSAIEEMEENDEEVSETGAFYELCGYLHLID